MSDVSMFHDKYKKITNNTSVTSSGLEAWQVTRTYLVRTRGLAGDYNVPRQD